MLTSLLWYGVALPALLSAAVLLVRWPWKRCAMPARADACWVALALGLGCAAGHIGIEGGRSFPPRDVADRLFYLLLAAVALSVLGDWRACPRWLLGMLQVMSVAALVWFLLPPALRNEASVRALTCWLAGLGLAVLFFGWMLALTARRLPSATLPLILLIVSAGTTAVLYRGHSVTLTRLAGALVAVLVPILARSACKPSLLMAMAPVVVLLPGLWLRSYFYDYEPPPTMSFLLLAAASLAGVLGLLPGVRSLASWQRCLIGVVAAFLLVTGALLACPHENGYDI